MAIAYTIVINKVTVFGDQRVVYATLSTPASGSNTYTSGGDTITPASVGLAYIDYADANALITTSNGANAYVVNITPGVGENVAAKIQLYTSNGAAPNALAEETNGTAVASFSMNVQFFGV
jgi:hypothetical protein